MTSSKSFVLLVPVALVLGLLACSVGTSTPIANPLDAAGTVVSMTLQALGSATPAAPTSTSTAVPVTATATTKPSLTINTNAAKCTEAPKAGATEVVSFAAGTVVDMIAKDTVDSYWLVKDPASGSSCWVQTKDATPSGSFDLLPEVTPAANSSASVPGRPGRVNYNYSCEGNSLTTTLIWSAAQGSVSGYRVYRLGNLVTQLPANATTYTETTDFTIGLQMNYAVEAYNDAGASTQLTWNFTCP